MTSNRAAKSASLSPRGGVRARAGARGQVAAGPGTVRAERDDLRTQTQLLARIVQVLEIENHLLKETTKVLERQVASRTGVLDLTRRRRS